MLLLVTSLLVSVASLAVWLRRTATSISIDDYSPLIPFTSGPGKLSIVTKLAYLLGIPMPQLEQSRFLFFPRSASSPALAPPGMGHARALRFLRARAGADVGAGPARRALVVAFCGGAANKVGIPRTEFKRTLSRPGAATARCDQLFVLDPTGMSFYSHGWADFERQLADLLGCYPAAVLVGNCMGGTGALLCAGQLGSPASTVLVFNPEVAPARDARLTFRAAAWGAPQVCAALPLRLQRACARSRARVRVHASVWPPELQQSRWLDMPERAAAADGGGGGGGGGERLLRVVHHDWDSHGLLAKNLQLSGGLAALLDEAAGHALANSTPQTTPQ